MLEISWIDLLMIDQLLKMDHLIYSKIDLCLQLQFKYTSWLILCCISKVNTEQ